MFFKFVSYNTTQNSFALKKRKRNRWVNLDWLFFGVLEIGLHVEQNSVPGYVDISFTVIKDLMFGEQFLVNKLNNYI